MRITKNFEGGNIRVRKIEGNTVYLAVELRDTIGDWFYWAFRVDDAAGKTLRFVFENTTRVGFYGAAVSHDCRHWQWQYETPDHHGAEFSYTFASDENCVYFAHNMLYLPERLYAFAESHRIRVDTLSITRRGRKEPCLTIGNGLLRIGRM